MKSSILKRLEAAEKKMIPKDVDVIVYIEETDRKGIFKLQESVYAGKSYRQTIKEVEGQSVHDVADEYEPPTGCREPIIFLMDLGEEDT